MNKASMLSNHFVILYNVNLPFHHIFDCQIFLVFFNYLQYTRVTKSKERVIKYTNFSISTFHTLTVQSCTCIISFYSDLNVSIFPYTPTNDT